MARGKPRLPLHRFCYHVGGTCYEPARIFRFAYMRKTAVKRLRELVRRHPVRILDYLLYPDGYRLLVEAEHPGRITEALKSFHLGTGHDYRSRREWQGPIWRQRGAVVTLVRKGPHALRCALDMDFQMVRSGDADLFHPLLWDHSGHAELAEVRKRYRVVDRAAVRHCLMDTEWERFREWYITAATARWNSGEIAAEPWWENALAVGSQQLCESVADTLPVSWLKLRVYPALKTVPGLEDTMCWTVSMSAKKSYEYIRSLIPGA